MRRNVSRETFRPRIGAALFPNTKLAEYFSEQIIRRHFAGNRSKGLLRQTKFFGAQLQLGHQPDRRIQMPGAKIQRLKMPGARQKQALAITPAGSTQTCRAQRVSTNAGFS